jgi:hypothetical protein
MAHKPQWLARRSVLWVAGYLVLCGLAYLAGVLGDTDSSGLSYLWLIFLLFPWVMAWTGPQIVEVAPFWLIVSSCMALNSLLIWWIVERLSRPRPRRPRKWRVEVNGSSVEVVRRMGRAGRDH